MNDKSPILTEDLEIIKAEYKRLIKLEKEQQLSEYYEWYKDRLAEKLLDKGVDLKEL